MNIHNRGFENIDYYKFTTYIEICCCYYKLGNIKEAKEYNEKAGKIKPGDDVYIYKYFESIK